MAGGGRLDPEAQAALEALSLERRREIIAAIRALPDEIEALTEGLTDDHLRWRPGPDKALDGRRPAPVE